MPTQVSGGILKNSLQPQFSSGFTYESDIALQEIEVGTTNWTGEDEIAIISRGTSRGDSRVHELYLGIPRDTANALARAIQSSNESRMPRIRLHTL